MSQFAVKTDAQVYHLQDLKALTFEDFPAESETKGVGIHQGKRFRTLQTTALNDQGREHRYTLRWTRHDSPVQALTAKLEAANKSLIALQEQENPKDFSRYCERLSKANERVGELEGELRQAKREGKPTPADKLRVKDHGATAAQADCDRAAKQANNQQRPSAAFLRYIFTDTGVTPNETQWELLANFLEGDTE